jgi:hypothetical protein
MSRCYDSGKCKEVCDLAVFINRTAYLNGLTVFDAHPGLKYLQPFLLEDHRICAVDVIALAPCFLTRLLR